MIEATAQYRVLVGVDGMFIPFIVEAKSYSEAEAKAEECASYKWVHGEDIRALSAHTRLCD